MLNDSVKEEYFEQLCNIVCGNRFSNKYVSFKKLLHFLHEVEFTWILPMDENRALDGIDMRDRLTGTTWPEPCSVLEMMVALSLRCEDFMYDETLGDRSGQWFWHMVTNLGLGYMDDNRFDRQDAEYIIGRFLNREYEPDGSGGLVTIRRCEHDLRDVEIWYQLNWYLSMIT